VQQRRQRPHGDLGPGGHAAHLLAELGDGIDDQREDQYGDDGEFPVPVKDDEDQADQGERILEHSSHGIGDGPLEGARIIGDPGHEDSRGMPGKKGQGLFLDLPVEAAAQIRDDPETDVVHQDHLSVAAQPFGKIDENHHQGDPDEHLGVLLQKNAIEGGFDEEGQGGG